eukprot:3640083-Alexandrium_andersonii.AAC.1
MVSVNPTTGPSHLAPDYVLQLQVLTDRGAIFWQPPGKVARGGVGGWAGGRQWEWGRRETPRETEGGTCLLYTSDAADDM